MSIFSNQACFNISYEPFFKLPNLFDKSLTTNDLTKSFASLKKDSGNLILSFKIFC